MLHLKDPSLHHFRQNYPEREANLQRIYGIDFFPSDTAIREGIDAINPADVQSCFRVSIQEVENQGVMGPQSVGPLSLHFVRRYATLL